jgi:N-glycosylase/DNA lyase
MTLDQLNRAYAACRSEIRERLDEFTLAGSRSDRALFEELCFCILAANSSAEMGLRTLEAVRDLLWDGELEAIRERLSGRFRYWRIRPAYIVSTREFLRKTCGLRLKNLVGSFADPEARRDFFAANPGIRGIGYKEASHFLRNIGFRGYAILDKHVMACLRELGVIGRRLAPSNPRRYRLIERRMRRFSADVGIDFDELDLLLWKCRTGKILK